MSKTISEARTKRSVTATAASPPWRRAKTSPCSVAMWTCSTGSPPARRRPRAAPPRVLAQRVAVAVGGEHLAAGAEDRAAAQVGRHLGQEGERPARAASPETRLGGGAVGHLGENTGRAPRPSLLDHRRRRLRDRRGPLRAQRLHRLRDHRRRRRARRRGQPAARALPYAGAAQPARNGPRPSSRGRAARSRARRGSAPRPRGSRPRSRRASRGRARGRARGWSRSGTGRGSRCSGGGRRGGRAACGSRRPRGCGRRRSPPRSGPSPASGSASSTSTPEERRMIRIPATTIATATIRAVIESKATTPVISTSARPTRTPAEVIASVRRWAASPSSASDSCARAWRESTRRRRPGWRRPRTPSPRCRRRARSTSAPTTSRWVAS